MNKQEVIEEIKKLEGLTILDKTINFDSKMISKEKVLNIVKQLDGPEKPVVPKFVAEWIEYCKSNKLTFLGAFHPVSEHGIRFADTLTDEIWKAIDWAKRNQETFARAWLDGYEVEKEKLYTVEIPNPNKIGNERNVLMKNGFNQIVLLRVYDYDDNWRNNKAYQLTEAEIKEYFGWAWQWRKEVKE